MDKVLKSQKVQSVRQLQGDSSPRRNQNSSRMISVSNLKSPQATEATPEPNSPMGQTSEERAVKVREFVNRARY